ncbi:MAG: ribbon-helix-helix protein, CopG family [Nostoc sp.]|uniref:ribbon-helix-helix protein, CopG family n=1 Tax=Nostoc sp. TaxID=1180 RepID=UPI002FF8457C
MSKEVTEPRINIRVDNDIKEAFARKVEAEGKTMTVVVTELIEQYLGLGQRSNELADLRQRLEAVERTLSGEYIA